MTLTIKVFANSFLFYRGFYIILLKSLMSFPQTHSPYSCSIHLLKRSHICSQSRVQWCIWQGGAFLSHVTVTSGLLPRPNPYSLKISGSHFLSEVWVMTLTLGCFRDEMSLVISDIPQYMARHSYLVETSDSFSISCMAFAALCTHTSRIFNFTSYRMLESMC